MSKTRILTGAFLVLIFSFPLFAQQETVVRSAKARQMLLGRHRLSLQWISWNYFGTALVTQKSGVLYLKGSQRGRGQNRGDYLTVDGVITSVGAREFSFEGKIVTRVSHINGGEPCVREGEMIFRITGSRRYWRLQQMDNPCDEVTDYVDVFFK